MFDFLFSLFRKSSTLVSVVSDIAVSDTLEEVRVAASEISLAAIDEEKGWKEMEEEAVAAVEELTEPALIEPQTLPAIRTHEPAEVIKDEMHLVEFPLGLISRRVPMIKKTDGTKEPIKTIEYTDTITIDGKPAERKWIVTGSDKFGLTTGDDDDVWLAILAAGLESGFKSQAVSLPSTYNMLRRLYSGKIGGEQLRRVKQSLLTLKGISIYTENVVKDKKGGHYLRTKAFNLVDDIEIVERYRPGKRSKAPDVFGYIKLSDTIYKFIVDGNIKNLDYAFYRGLPNPLTKRLFRYLDKQRYWGASCSRKVFELCLKLGFARSALEKYQPQRRRDYLTPALDELVQRKFLTRYEWRRAKDGDRLIVFFANPGTGSPTGNPYGLTDEQHAQAQLLAQDITEVCSQADRNAGYYFKTAALAVKGNYTDRVHRALSETKAADVPAGTVGNRSKYFNQRMEELKHQFSLTA